MWKIAPVRSAFASLGLLAATVCMLPASTTAQEPTPAAPLWIEEITHEGPHPYASSND
jgi:hypothetical protein